MRILLYVLIALFLMGAAKQCPGSLSDSQLKQILRDSYESAVYILPCRASHPENLVCKDYDGNHARYVFMTVNRYADIDQCEMRTAYLNGTLREEDAKQSDHLIHSFPLDVCYLSELEN